jgi:hypothetical protein
MTEEITATVPSAIGFNEQEEAKREYIERLRTARKVLSHSEGWAHMMDYKVLNMENRSQLTSFSAEKVKEIDRLIDILENDGSFWSEFSKVHLEYQRISKEISPIISFFKFLLGIGK